MLFRSKEKSQKEIEEAKEYFKEATKWNKGDVDKSNNFTTLVDMWNLPISKLEEK